MPYEIQETHPESAWWDWRRGIFDAIYEDGHVTIELKNSKKELVLVPWEDIKFQVEASKSANVTR